MAHMAIRPGILDRLKSNAGIASDEAFARLIGVSRATLVRVRDQGELPSAIFIAGVSLAFGLGPGEVATVVESAPTVTEAPAAA